MDLSTAIYDSTQHNSFYPPSSVDHVMTASDITAFVGQLLSTIELEELGAIYFQAVKKYLPLEGLSLTDFDARLIYGDAKMSAIQFERPLKQNVCTTSDASNVYYFFSQTLSLSQKDILDQLHCLFEKQVVHALSFRLMHQMATKDMLTGLGNRAGFDSALSRAISWSHRHQETFALLVIDLDNFKAVNDSFGHREGDKVLMNVASQLAHVLRDEDELFRFGGDEFCCVLDCQTQQQLECAALRVKAAINGSAYLSRMGVSCSLGGAIYREGESVASIFDRADNALYQVKQSGKNNYYAA